MSVHNTRHPHIVNTSFLGTHPQIVIYTTLTEKNLNLWSIKILHQILLRYYKSVALILITITSKFGVDSKGTGQD